MDIMNSAWFLRMLEKPAVPPQLRLLNLFDVLGDWLSAPSIRESQFQQQMPVEITAELQAFLTREGKAAGAVEPEMLAHLLYFMALALSKELLSASDDNAAQKVAHAKKAALALIRSQTRKEVVIARPVAYALAVSIMAVLIGIAWWQPMHLTPQPLAVILSRPVLATPLDTTNPAETAAMFSAIQQMHTDNCQFVEALQLPDSYKKVYMEVVVGGQVSTSPADQALAKKLMQNVRCNYKPTLMQNSIG